MTLYIACTSVLYQMFLFVLDNVGQKLQIVLEDKSLRKGYIVAEENAVSHIQIKTTSKPNNFIEQIFFKCLSNTCNFINSGDFKLCCIIRELALELSKSTTKLRLP